MDIAERIRRARLVQIVSAVVGALASLVVLVEYARTHLAAALVLGILVLLAVLVRLWRELGEVLWRYRRDLLFTLLGAVVGGAVCFAWMSQPLPVRSPPKLSAFEAPEPSLTSEIEIPEPLSILADSSEIVYRTPSGKRYHRATCGHVRGKETPLSISEAEEQGLTPCRVCNPPPLP